MVTLDTESGRLIKKQHTYGLSTPNLIEFTDYDLEHAKYQIEREIKLRQGLETSRFYKLTKKGKLNKQKESKVTIEKEIREKYKIQELINFSTIGAQRYPRNIEIKFSTNLTDKELELVETVHSQKIKEINEELYKNGIIVSKRLIAHHVDTLKVIKQQRKEEDIIKEYNYFMIYFLEEVMKYKSILEKESDMNCRILLNWLDNFKNLNNENE